MARRKAPHIADELLDQLLSGTDAATALQQGGLLDELKKSLAERALNAEMEHHLAAETGNSRNGYGHKTVTTETGSRPSIRSSSPSISAGSRALTTRSSRCTRAA